MHKQSSNVQWVPLVVRDYGKIYRRKIQHATKIQKQHECNIVGDVVQKLEQWRIACAVPLESSALLELKPRNDRCDHSQNHVWIVN